MNELELHGIGPVLKADDPVNHVKAGKRIRWALSLSPMRELLDLPLRVRANFEVVEDDVDSRRYALPIGNGRCAEATLGQLIQGVLQELSCTADRRARPSSAPS